MHRLVEADTMEKLREMVIQMATANQKKPLSSSQVAYIQQQLLTSFPAGLHTPHHPPYAAMIYKAITELNEEGGSTEESISQFIQAKYKDLPFAHKSYLSQHLRKLSDKGFVVFTAANCYMIATFTRTLACKRTPSINRKHGVDRVTPPPTPIEYRASEDTCFLCDESKGNNGRKRRMQRHRQLVFDDEEELCNATTMKLSLAREIRRLDNKGRRRSESRKLPPETAKQKKLILNKSGDETVLLQEQDSTNGIDSKVLQTKGESSKVLVKRKKKDMIKWMIKALSDFPPEKLPDEAEMRLCLTMPIEKSKEQDTSTNNGNQITDHKERKHPSLLQRLVQTSFFDKCKVHLDAASNNCHSYCFNCMSTFCTFCRVSHQDHHVIRIYRTMWENSVSASKIQMYIEISGIQTHHFGPNMDCVSLKRTVQSRHRKHFSGACVICKRYLPESFKFCSLNCKIEHDLASYMPSATN